ncbi:hypothetical protein B1207_00890 [Legionella quinlivanii]|uniref:Beta-lactamase-related domain-containing protein n=1 Tax=Legionella quinlivanii TaxID=45073 RepID=A0A364LN42_9GAMM|nr:alpha/beta hydrolase-fold protein [Legionella quinlivanii]RAP38477.1 hypothetical protein B1207_00890 [Legionella quinlivanii]
MPESLKIMIDGPSAGLVEILIDTDSSAISAAFIYTPDTATPAPYEMLLGYHDAAGEAHQLPMTLQKNGQWTAKRTMAPNESSDFYMHPNVKPGKLTQKPDIISKIALSDGKIIASVYENPELPTESKGSIQRRVLNAEGILSEPVDEHHQIKPGEQLIEVYIPAGYESSDSKVYPVQVMLDGGMHLRQDAFGNSMGTKTILDNLIANGRMLPIVAVFVSPSPPTQKEGQWVSMPRLGEYACDLKTDAMLKSIPGALKQAGMKTTEDPKKTGLCGQSMGGLQALYTAKMHPEIFGQVIAQSPAVWWGPPAPRLNNEENKSPARYEDDETWRAPLSNQEEQQYLLKMLNTGYDQLSRQTVPQGEVSIYLQAGTHETGDRNQGDEPLTQSVMTLARKLNIGCKLHNGGHTAESWATGLAILLPQAHPAQPALETTEEVNAINEITRSSTEELMRSANIQGAAIASYSDAHISTLSIGTTAKTPFGVASLSKPVFAYLVLKLLEANNADEAIPGFGKFNSSDSQFDLDTPLYQVFRDASGETLADNDNPFLKNFKPEDWDLAKQLNARIILSHRTGLHIVEQKPYSFQFAPGAYYAYSGPGIDCLQMAIEELTHSDLETLAWANVFAAHALNMSHSSYGDEPVAANSLKTTAEDYAALVSSWINDERLNYAFKPQEPIYTMENDYFPQSKDMLVEEITIDASDRKQVSWGLGVGLVIKDKEVVGAYHTGDMNQWRSGFGAEIAPETGRCQTTRVYCANGANGHILAEKILPKALSPALNYFFPTYGFARNVKELDETSFHGMNPQRLKPDLKEQAYQTKNISNRYKELLQGSKSEKTDVAVAEVLDSAQQAKPATPNPFSMEPKPH